MPTNLYDKIGQFTTIPNTIIEMWPELGDSIALFLYLRYRSDRNDTCFPSYDTIQRDTGMSRQRISRMMKVLVEKGILEKRKRFSKSTVYVLKMPSISSETRLLLVPIPHTNQIQSNQKKNNIQEVSVDNMQNLKNLFMVEDDPEESAEEKARKEKILQALGSGMSEHEKRGWSPDSAYPEDVREVLLSFYEHFKIKAPDKGSKRFTFWISSSRELIEACGEFAPDRIISEIHGSWKKEGMRWDIDSPNALVNKARGEAGRIRSSDENVIVSGSWTPTATEESGWNLEE